MNTQLLHAPHIMAVKTEEMQEMEVGVLKARREQEDRKRGRGK